jgi:iron(III) transport system substrate-binding protein
MTLLAAGCGGDDSEESSSSAAGEGSASGSSSAPDADAEWEQVVEAAKEEGELVIYSAAPPDDNEEIVEGFTEAYPEIDVEVLRINTQELTPRFEAEARGGAKGADALLTVAPTHQVDWAEEGLLAPLVGPHVTDPQFSDVVFADGTTVIPALNVLGFGYNPAAVNEPPRFEDLATPAFKGKLGGYDWVATSTLAVNAYIGETFGEEWFEGAAENKPRFYTSTVQIAQDMAAGVIDAAWVMVESAVGDLPIELAYPERPPAFTYQASVSANAAHPNAAQLWVDWALTMEGQEAWASDGVSVLPDVEGALRDISTVEPMGVEWYDEELQSKWLSFLQETFDRQ